LEDSIVLAYGFAIREATAWRIANRKVFVLTHGSNQDNIYCVKDEALLTILEQTVARLSIKLDYDDLRKGEVNTPGGAFVLRGKRHIIIHKNLSVKEKVEVLIEILAGLDTEGVHIPPEVRERIDQARRSERV
jgi:hypothetical protein